MSTDDVRPTTDQPTPPQTAAPEPAPSAPTITTPPHRGTPAIVTVEGHDETFARAFARGFHETFRPEEFALESKLVEGGRMFGHQVDGRWVSTCGDFARTMTTPGGQVDVAAVTVVTVAPGYRRRGLLRELMHHQLTQVRATGTQPLALLWASESLIYGRFGYGRTTAKLRLSGPTRATAFLPEVAPSGGSVDEVGREQFAAAAYPLREAWLPDRPGHLNRTEAWWDFYLFDAEHRRNGAEELRYALHFAEDGTVDGWATFRTKYGDTVVPDGGDVIVTGIDAADPRVYAALWRWLLDLDLMRGFRFGHAATDEPLRQLVADQRAIKTELQDATYARIVDVPAALGARRYTSAVGMTVELTDTFLPDLAGRYRLELGPDGAEVTRTDAAADLTLDVRHLGAIYLGGTALTDLHRAGLVGEHSPGAVLALSAAFASPRAPFCPDFF
ncbi:putative acetyltransferase [Friedmanniella endophytica]|uniref:Putative acetyltransferase n=1 Tax=Microlunatus kandeliicorticis TaxID=1759536 RepID=A0A7W3IVG8_9ACTN|nr:GNAT family N-acetyltransferase [Microlunatus kandeliicorticis]MBA8796008.1 putative acetyltransferase [Microlunatus kandeliicorticis]